MLNFFEMQRGLSGSDVRKFSLAKLVLGFSVLLCTIISVQIFIQTVIAPGHYYGYDFRIFYEAGKVFLQRGNPYLKYYVPFQPTSNFPYLPWVGLFFSGFHYFKLVLAYGIWDIFIFISIFGSIYLLTREFGWRHNWWICLLCAISPVALYNYLLGQTSSLELLFLVLTIVSVRRRLWLWAGVSSALAVLLKTQDVLILIPLMWLTVQPWEWRAITKIIVGQISAAIFLIGAPLLFNYHLMGDWFTGISHFSSTFSTNVGTRIPISIYGLSLFFHLQTNQRTILGHAALIGLPICSVILIGFMLYWMKRRSQWRALLVEDRSTWIILLALLIWIVLTPFANVQDLVIVLPIVIFLIGRDGYYLQKWQGMVPLAAMWVIPIIPGLLFHNFFPQVSIYFIATSIVLFMCIQRLRF